MAKSRIGDLLVSSCFKGRISGKAIGDCQIGEHKNLLYPFNVGPTSRYGRPCSRIEDYGLEVSMNVPRPLDFFVRRFFI